MWATLMETITTAALTFIFKLNEKKKHAIPIDRTTNWV